MEKEEEKPKVFTQDMVNEIVSKEVSKAKSELGSKLSLAYHQQFLLLISGSSATFASDGT